MTPEAVESIICDGCGKEMIQHTSYPEIYAFELRAIDVNRNNTGKTFLVSIAKPKTAHFCNKKCIASWISVPGADN